MFIPARLVPSDKKSFSHVYNECSCFSVVSVFKVCTGAATSTLTSNLNRFWGHPCGFASEMKRHQSKSSLNE